MACAARQSHAGLRKVKCVADIELGMLSGTGGLIKMD